jgi:hypothetical protein
MASAKGFDFYMFCPPNVRRFLGCRNKYRAETSGVATFCLRLQHCLQQSRVNNAAVAVVTSIQLGINQFILKPITNEVN